MFVLYDIDGVLLPDIRFAFREVRHAVKPMFVPERPFALVTGRPVADRTVTILWMERYGLRPDYLFHENTDIDKAVEYKVSVINSMNPPPDLFVESDRKQAAAIAKLVKVDVVVFEDVVKGAISGKVRDGIQRAESVSA